MQFDDRSTNLSNSQNKSHTDLMRRFSWTKVSEFGPKNRNCANCCDDLGFFEGVLTPPNSGGVSDILAGGPVTGHRRLRHRRHRSKLSTVRPSEANLRL